MGVIRDTFNAVYADGPSISPSMPSKPEIRILGGIIEDYIQAEGAGGDSIAVEVQDARGPSPTLGARIDRTTASVLVGKNSTNKGQALNDGVLLTDTLGNINGLKVPANKTASLSYAIFYVPFTAREAARLAFRTVRFSVEIIADAGFLAAHPFDLASPLRLGMDSLTAGGTIVRNEQIGNVIYRDIDYVFAGDESFIGVPIQLADSTAVSSEMSWVLGHLTWRASDTGQSAETPTGVGSELAIRELASERFGFGRVFDDWSVSTQIFNGATLTFTQDGRIGGFSVPAGQNGGLSYTQYLLAIDKVEASKINGATVMVHLGIDTSTDYNRPLGVFARYYVDGVQQTGSDVRVLQNKQVTPNRREVVYTFVLTGLATSIAPTLQQTSGTVVTSTIDAFVLTDMDIEVIDVANGDPETTAVKNIAIATRRATREAISRTVGPQGNGYARTLRVETDGSGDYTTVDAALAAAKGAGPLYRYEIVVGRGKFTTSGLQLKDYVDIRGVDRNSSWIAGYLVASSPAATIASTSTINGNANVKLGSLRITCQNMRYPIHDDRSGAGPALKATYEDCTLEHLGNDEARAYQTSIGGDPNTIWVGEAGYGMGTSSGDEWVYRNCRFIGKRDLPFATHNNKGFKVPSRVRLERCDLRVQSTTPSGFRYGVLGSGVGDILELVDCRLSRSIILEMAPWIPTDLPSQIADKAGQLNFSGSGNTPVPFTIADEGSRALRIDSLTANSSSSVVVSGSAVAVLFGTVLNYANAADLSAGVYGTADVGEHAVGINQNQFITALGKRLGDRTSSSLSLVVTIDGGSPLTVTFNQNYSAQSNATILAAINAVLTGKGTASLMNVNDLYRPAFPDQETWLQNTGATTILRKTAVAYTSSQMAGRRMTTTDAPSLFAGIAYEDIRPSAWGRVKTRGEVWVAQDMIRSDSAAFTRGDSFVVGDGVGRFAKAASGNIIMTATSADYAVLNKTF
ncbi:MULTISPECIES: hypothetical protein [unclassified Rhizobium]|uniref:hypothetical protein n=1 Tax=unclassified Rhizobium TaxID=2613769 RepID=UPI00288C03AB|nr:MULTISPECIES: hypothetical protein [unclassified Rhizobium]